MSAGEEDIRYFNNTSNKDTETAMKEIGRTPTSLKLSRPAQANRCFQYPRSGNQEREPTRPRHLLPHVQQQIVVKH